MERYTFNKNEKLKSRKAIEALFRSGSSLSSPPFRLVYRKVNQDSFPVLMTVAVPKKLIKKAVHRNLLKRRTREAYRLNKTAVCKLAAKKNQNYELLFVYQTNEIVDYSIIKSSIQALLFRLAEKMKNS